MRIHCLENVDKALQFLKEQRVHLENVGSHDIVDGNHRLTLGLIWTIILRFQVSWRHAELCRVCMMNLMSSVNEREKLRLRTAAQAVVAAGCSVVMGTVWILSKRYF